MLSCLRPHTATTGPVQIQRINRSTWSTDGYGGHELALTLRKTEGLRTLLAKNFMSMYKEQRACVRTVRRRNTTPLEHNLTGRLHTYEVRSMELVCVRARS